MTLDQEDSVIVWSWHQHGRKRREYGTAMTDRRWRHLSFVRLRSRGQVHRFVRGLQSS